MQILSLLLSRWFLLHAFYYFLSRRRSFARRRRTDIPTLNNFRAGTESTLSLALSAGCANKRTRGIVRQETDEGFILIHGSPSRRAPRQYPWATPFIVYARPLAYNRSHFACFTRYFFVIWTTCNRSRVRNEPDSTIAVSTECSYIIAIFLFESIVSFSHLSSDEFLYISIVFELYLLHFRHREVVEKHFWNWSDVAAAMTPVTVLPGAGRKKKKGNLLKCSVSDHFRRPPILHSG